MKTLLIHSIVPSSTVNGPGARMVVWTQGCTLACPGCWNPETHGLKAPPEMYGMGSFIAELQAVAHQIEGITFSGGEPMQQPEQVLHAMDWVRMGNPKMSLGMYTGYTLKELNAGENQPFGEYVPPGKRIKIWKKIQGMLDFAVMGRYNEAQRDTKRPLCSSRNQKLVLFSDRYRMEDFRPLEVQVTIKPGGEVITTGFPIYGQVTE